MSEFLFILIKKSKKVIKLIPKIVKPRKGKPFVKLSQKIQKSEMTVNIIG